MKRVVLLVVVIAVLLCGCVTKTEINTYHQISQVEAKTMMDSQDVVVLDVRELYEYEESHIADSVLLPVGSITAETAAELIPANDSIVLVYCRSGNRSKTASQKLVELGYENVYEFGGINTWPYEVE